MFQLFLRCASAICQTKSHCLNMPQSALYLFLLCGFAFVILCFPHIQLVAGWDECWAGLGWAAHKFLLVFVWVFLVEMVAVGI